MSLTLQYENMDVAEEKVERIHCDCCNGTTLSLQGSVSEQGQFLAGYDVRWTDGNKHIDATFRLFFGNWDDGSDIKNRYVMRADFRSTEGSFMILDAADGIPDTTNATYFKRNEIIGTETAAECFAVIDAIFMKHSQLESLRP